MQCKLQFIIASTIDSSSLLKIDKPLDMFLVNSSLESGFIATSLRKVIKPSKHKPSISN